MALIYLDNGKGKKRGRPPIVPDQLTEEEAKYIYRNPEGKIIFTPLYEIYTDDFLREVVENTKIIPTYDMFRETAWMEKYTANVYQFAAAKSAEQAQAMQREVYDDKGKLRSWAQFRNRADEIQYSSNKVWLRVEHDNCARQAVMADKFNDMRADADLYPYWIYSGRLDSRERPEHRALEGLIFRIGDSYGDACYPPEDWNCRCTAKAIDNLYLKQHNRVVQTNEQAKGWLEGVDDKGKPFVDPQFRYNPADQGMMPKIGGQYFKAMKNANEGNADLFGIRGEEKPDIQGYTSKPLPNFAGILHEWKSKHHVDRFGNIVFQNEALLSNVWLTNVSTHKIHGHPRGVDLLPDTIAHPSEVWMRWEDTDAQQVVLRNYISFGKDAAYLVSTRDGAIQDAVLLSKGQIEKHRVGVPWIK